VGGLTTVDEGSTHPGAEITVMEHVARWLLVALFTYMAVVPFIFWGWMSEGGRGRAIWWLLAILVGAAYAFAAADSMAFGALLLACIIGFGVVRFLRRPLGPPRALINLLPYACLLGLFFCNADFRFRPMHVDWGQFVIMPAMGGAVSVVATLLGFGVGKLLLRRRPSRIPVLLGAFLPLLINPFHPYMWAAYAVGGISGWSVASKESVQQRTTWGTLMELAGVTFVFWFVSAGAWSTLMGQSWPLGPAYAEMFIANVALSFFYGRRAHLIAAPDRPAPTTVSDYDVPVGLGVEGSPRARLWRRAGLVMPLLLFWVGATLWIGMRYPLFLLGTFPAWLAGFMVAKSTRVPLRPTEVPFTPRVRLSHREYDRWAQRMLAEVMDQRFFFSTGVHWTEKLPLAFCIFGASLHVWALTWCALLLAPTDMLLGLFVFSPGAAERLSQMPPGQVFGFGAVCAIMLGHIAGWASGLFYRRLRARE